VGSNSTCTRWGLTVLEEYTRVKKKIHVGVKIHEDGKKYTWVRKEIHVGGKKTHIEEKGNTRWVRKKIHVCVKIQGGEKGNTRE